jgi:hypothetical protein
LFTTAEARASGLSDGTLRWGERTGQWRRIERGVYGEGRCDPDALDVARARVIAARTYAGGRLAGVLYGLDGVALDGIPVRRRGVPPARLVRVADVACTNGFQTMVDLAAELDDLIWEQALESAVRKRLTTVGALAESLPHLGRVRTRGTTRIRRVLALRPPGAPPTESLLETLMVQLVRTVKGLEDPVRQHEVHDEDGSFVARIDLCWPELGLFVELDGEQHRDQPLYDARRETAVVAATGWLPGRFTWHEVAGLPRTTARRLAALADQASRSARAGRR